MKGEEDLVQDPFRIDVMYELEFDDKNSKKFSVKTDLTSKEVAFYSQNRYPWTELDFHKCEHCTLSKMDFPYCPAITSIIDIVEFFSKHPEYKTARCTVVLPEKNIFVEKPVSEILSCLIGLRMASSLCPFLSQLKILARFHEPFATPYYTVFRATSLHLLRQYFNKQKGFSYNFEFSGLTDLYEKLGTINMKMSERLKNIKDMKCEGCSMTILSTFTVTMTLLFEEHLKILQELDQQ